MDAMTVVEVEVCSGCDRVIDEKRMSYCPTCETHLCDDCLIQGEDCPCPIAGD